MQQFDPGVLGLFINPFYVVRKELMSAMRSLAPALEGTTLDIGCGHRPYEKIFTHSSSYVGLEYDTPHNRSRFKKIDAWYRGERFPFERESFDSAILTQVLEHVFNPDIMLSEIHRVLKPGGQLLLSVPFAWDEHEQPHDYARYSSFGLIHLLEKHGFQIDSHIKTVPDVRIIFQLAGCYIHKKIAWIRSYRIRLLLYVLLISPLTILGTFMSWILPPNPDLYMDNVILVRKK